MNTKSFVVLLVITILSLGVVSSLHTTYAINTGGPFSSSQNNINSQSAALSTSQPNTIVTSNPTNKQVIIESGAGVNGPNGPCVTARSCFNPSDSMISPGDTVTWTNTDTVFHTVTSGNPTDSPVGTLFDRTMAPGNSISIIFNNPGTISYFCKIHPWLVGQVFVGLGISNSQGGIFSTNSTSNQSNSNSNSSISQSAISVGNQSTLSGILAGQKISQTGFKADMRKLWEDHITWTRVFIISEVAGLGDTNAATTRLLQNQDDIGNAIKPFYGNDAGNQLTSLLKTHITTAAAFVTDSKAGKTVDAATAEKNWYANVDQIAAFLAKANPTNWPEQPIKNMLDEHLVLTKQEAVARLSGNWTGDIAAFDQIHNQALMMADELSNGIITQFPQDFTQ